VRARSHFKAKSTATITHTVTAATLRTMPTVPGIAQMVEAERHAFASPAKPRTIPKNDAGTWGRRIAEEDILSCMLVPH
jgi:hypothetical protein